jgi:hypothetical protein
MQWMTNLRVLFLLYFSERVVLVLDIKTWNKIGTSYDWRIILCDKISRNRYKRMKYKTSKIKNATLNFWQESEGDVKSFQCA